MFYSTKQTAELLGYNDDSYIRRLILEGKLKANKFGRQWVVDSQDIENYKNSLTPSQIKYRTFFQYNEELHALVDACFNKDLPLRNPRDAVVSMFMAKAFKTHNALLHLCRSGFGEDASILSRSLFEMMITLLYLLRDPTDERAFRYFAFNWILQKRMFDAIKDDLEGITALDERMKHPKKNDVTLDEVERNAAEAEKKYHFGKSDNWANKGIHEMARAIGQEKAYKTAYRLQCQLAHSSPRSMTNYTVSEDGGNIVLAVDDPFNWVQESLITGFGYFSQIVEAFDIQFKLGLEKNLQTLVNKYADAVNGTIN